LNALSLGQIFNAFGYKATDADVQDKVNECGGEVNFDAFCYVMYFLAIFSLSYV
jgi:Ca2+-binding EF-hand superfamily protein